MNELQTVGNPKICVAACIIRDGRLLIGLRHYTPDKWKKVDMWTTPGGRCEVGETVGDTLRRETAEEVGVTELKIAAFLGIVPGAMPGDTLYVFACETAQEPRLMEPEKFSEWKWEEIGKIPPNFINPAALNLIVGFVEKRGRAGA